eukprot:jgi/Mesvir1/4186/Mv08897-RA.1
MPHVPGYPELEHVTDYEEWLPSPPGSQCGENVVAEPQLIQPNTQLSAPVESDAAEIWQRRRKRAIRLAWIILILVVLGGVGVLIWQFWPVIVEDVVIPALTWAENTFTRPQMAFLIMGCLFIAPVIFVTSAPFLWLAGIVFGYALGMLICIIGTTVGMSLAFWAGRRWLHARVQRWLDKKKKLKTVISMVERRAPIRGIFLLRLTPVPYTAINYACAGTTVSYRDFMIGSIGNWPELFVALYTGIILEDIAALAHGGGMNKMQIVQLVVGITACAIILVGGTVFAKRALQTMVEEEARTLEQNQLQSAANAPPNCNLRSGLLPSPVLPEHVGEAPAASTYTPPPLDAVAASTTPAKESGPAGTVSTHTTSEGESAAGVAQLSPRGPGAATTKFADASAGTPRLRQSTPDPALVDPSAVSVIEEVALAVLDCRPPSPRIQAGNKINV